MARPRPSGCVENHGREVIWVKTFRAGRGASVTSYAFISATTVPRTRPAHLGARRLGRWEVLAIRSTKHDKRSSHPGRHARKEYKFTNDKAV